MFLGTLNRENIAKAWSEVKLIKTFL